MTHEQLSAEMFYHASLSPFKKLVADGLISEEDYLTIDTILRAKYSPIFVEVIINLSLDIKENQR
jgi:hypothetical protein